MMRGTSDQSRILFQQERNQNAITAAQTASKLQYVLQNQAAIMNTLQSQTTALKAERYVPFQPYYPVIEPISVTQLRQATANVGVPMSVFTVMNCKGIQSVTK
jgi:hypothetical protein